MPFLKPLKNINIIETTHENWKRLLQEADEIWMEDTNLRYKALKGMTIPDRSLPPEIVGRMYADYCTLVNKLHDAYTINIQLQKEPYMKQIISIILKRLFELREELVHLIVNDYIYIDAALIQNKITPFDLEVVVPYYYGIDMRKGSIEELLSEMYESARKRKLKAIRQAEREKKYKNKPPKEHQDGVEEEEEESVEEVPATPVQEESFFQALVIQRHERFRLFYINAVIEKCLLDKKYTLVEPIVHPPMICTAAARMIQQVYRKFMELKRKRALDDKRDILLGIRADPTAKKPDLLNANKMFYEHMSVMRRRMSALYQRDLERENARVYLFKKNAEIENITDEIREWFKEWYRDYHFFPDYPFPAEGGTILVVRGDWTTIEEKKIADEKYRKETEGKTQEQIKNERKQAIYDAKIKKQNEEVKQKKEAIARFKARGNPTSDYGYSIQQTNLDAKKVLDTYRQSWSWYDRNSVNDSMQSAYGYLMSVLTEDCMTTMHKECRVVIDELMQLDLQLLIKAHQEMLRLAGLKYPKRPKPKPPKLPPKPKIVELNEKNLNILHGVFDLEIITRPTRSLKEIEGDMKYGIYELNIKDPDCTFPSPGYGDVKNRLILSCAMGCGLDPGGKKNKAVLLLGPPRSGKSFMVDAIAGEINAVKIDISPESLNVKAEAPAKMLTKLFLAAKVFQPTIIFFRNIERLYYKKIPPDENYLRPRAIKTALEKLTKAIAVDDKIILIATCSNPWAANPKISKIFNDIIFVPPADYGTVVQMFRERISKLRSVPITFELQGLGRLFEGYGTGVLIDVFNAVATPKRISKLTQYPLQHVEFIEALVDANAERVTGTDLQAFLDWKTKMGPLYIEVEDYKLINKKRAEFFQKIAANEDKKKKVGVKT